MKLNLGFILAIVSIICLVISLVVGWQPSEPIDVTAAIYGVVAGVVVCFAIVGVITVVCILKEKLSN